MTEDSSRKAYMVCVTFVPDDGDTGALVDRLQAFCKGASKERIQQALENPPFTFRRMNFDSAQNAKKDLERLGCAVEIREGAGAANPNETVLWEKESQKHQMRLAKGVDADLIKKSIEIFSSSNAAVEAYRTLRTNLLVRMKEKIGNIFLITSPAPKEGKSTTVANLGIALANTGKKTLLLDLDLRAPVLHKYLGIDNSLGLSNVMLDNLSPEIAISRTIFDKLHILPTGPLQPNPAELLSSSAMPGLLDYLSAEFDLVIVDSPPIIGLTDSVVIGSAIGNAFLMIRSGHSSRQQAVQAMRMLENVNCRILGAVLNEVDLDKAGYGLYGYSNRH
ncbi:CpsD/CapB family tyrosine-protein kinase [bacterium]|nr:CpsD/CapB family tyrosine-protein kinase [bacterium]